MNAQDRMEIQIAKNMINSLERFYAPNCKIKDYDDLPGEIGRGLNDPSRCIACQAADVIEFLKEHIEFIEWENLT